MTTTPADQTAHDPLTVQCIDCLAPKGQACRTDNDVTHAARYDSARHAAALPGVCALCLAPMYRFTAPDDAYHLPGVSDSCPPLPNPLVDWNAYAAATAEGQTPGHPGARHWRPAVWPGDDITPEELDTCPECVAGKHVNCVRETLNAADEFVRCACDLRGHQ